MRLYPALIFSSFMVVSCGGGSGSDDTSIIVKNSAPSISPDISIYDATANGVIETSEPFDLLLKITDADNDTITGSIDLNGKRVALVDYLGTENFSHQASFYLDSFGVHTANIIASDGNNTNVTVDIDIAVIPNHTEVNTELESSVANFVANGEFAGLSLLGKSTDELNTTIGYLDNELSEESLAHNAAPSGECGVNTPHKLLSVDVTTLGITIPQVGMIFPLECLSKTQSEKLNDAKEKQRNSSEAKSSINSDQLDNYTAQHFSITDDSESGTSIIQTGVGIALEGVVSDVTCGDFSLPLQNGTFRLPAEQILNSITRLTAQSNSFTLACQRSIKFNSVEETSPLLAEITGELQTTDSTFPLGSIDSVTFSIPYLAGGLDQGTICVSATSSDNTGIASETVSLIADDGLTDSMALTFNDNTNQFCGELLGFDGPAHVKQVIIDDADNKVTNTSATYPIEKNDAPVFHSELTDTMILKANEGIISIVDENNVSDPESQTIIISGETSFDTNQPLGEYTITVIATDPYDEKTSKTITIILSDNTAPTASISLSGNPIKIGSSIRDVNNTITLALSSSDSDGTVNDSSLTTSINGGPASDIANYSSTYSHNISVDGGNTRSFTYQVTDNNGLDSAPEVLEFDVHLNTPPTYSGATTYSAERGQCVSIQQQGSDPESDSIIFSIEGGKWQICQDDVSQITKNVTVTDTYNSKSVAVITANFTNCSSPAYWDGNSCFIKDTRPNAFTFVSQTDVAINSDVISNPITVTGINSAASITITSSGSYSINGGVYTSAPGVVHNGDIVTVKVTSSNFANTLSSTILHIDAVNEPFAVTTGELNVSHDISLVVTSPNGDLRVDYYNTQNDYFLTFYSTLNLNLTGSSSSVGSFTNMQVSSDLRGVHYNGNALIHDVVSGTQWSIETFTITLTDDNGNISVTSFTIAWD
jgi:hypothetical protein